MKTRQEIIEELQELEKEYSEQITSIRGAILVLKGQIGVQPATINNPAVINKPVKVKTPFPDKICDYPSCGKSFTPKTIYQKYCDLTCSSHHHAEQKRAKSLEKDKEDHKFYISQKPPDIINPLPEIVSEIKKNEQ